MTFFVRGHRGLFLSAIIAALFVLSVGNMPAHATFKCEGTACTCSGDADCNDMFSKSCGKDNGSCTVDNNGGTKCSCTKKQNASGGKKTTKPTVTKVTSGVNKVSAPQKQNPAPAQAGTNRKSK
jgi:hypothetical protein